MIWAVTLLTMKLIPRSLTKRSFLQYSEFATIWYRVTSPHRNSALPLQIIVFRCTEIHFGENQLAPLSIGISPLTTPHPLIFQHQSVRASPQCYLSFTLDMVRSSGFGSIISDKFALFKLAFTTASISFFLTMPLIITRRNILQQARGKTLSRSSSDCKLVISQSFHTLSRGLFSFPSRYFLLLVIQ